MTSNKDISIGIIGEGHVRKLLIEKLIKENILVNLLEEQFQKNFVEQAYLCKSIFEFVIKSNIIITICKDEPELEEYLFGEDGITQFNMSNKIIVDMSSVSPEFIQELSEQLAEIEVDFLDAVIINETEEAHGAIQLIQFGGEKSIFENVQPLFERIATNVKHIGINGASQFYRQAFGVRKKVN